MQPLPGACARRCIAGAAARRGALLSLAALLGGLGGSSWSQAVDTAASSTLATPPAAASIKFTRLWVDAAGSTHLKRCELPKLEKKGTFGSPQFVRSLAGTLSPANVVFTQQIGENPWHPCPSSQFVVTLAGTWYVNTTDGDYMEFRPGDVLFQDDSKGLRVAGAEPVHYSGTIGGPCNQLVLSIARPPVVGEDDCDWAAAALTSLTGSSSQR